MDSSCRYLGEHKVGGEVLPRRVYLLPLLHIAGASLVCLLAFVVLQLSLLLMLLLACVVFACLLIHGLDLPETRKLGGIKNCPDCIRHSGLPRFGVDHEAVKAIAVDLMMRRRKKQAVDTLSDEADMSATHLRCDCPYVGRIAHMTPASMPGDRLHLQCVDA